MYFRVLFREIFMSNTSAMTLWSMFTFGSWVACDKFNLTSSLWSEYKLCWQWLHNLIGLLKSNNVLLVLVLLSNSSHYYYFLIIPKWYLLRRNVLSPAHRTPPTPHPTPTPPPHTHTHTHSLSLSLSLSLSRTHTTTTPPPQPSHARTSTKIITITVSTAMLYWELVAADVNMCQGHVWAGRCVTKLNVLVCGTRRLSINLVSTMGSTRVHQYSGHIWPTLVITLYQKLSWLICCGLTIKSIFRIASLGYHNNWIVSKKI